MDRQIKLSDLEKYDGIIYDPNVDIEQYALPSWYNKVRNNRIIDLEDNDIAICIRQSILLNYIVPEALTRLFKDPTIGHQYDGEVITALSRINDCFWKNNFTLIKETQRLLDEIISGKLISKDFKWMYDNQEHEFYDEINLFIEKLYKIESDMK
jgi:hypothetical protein